MKIITDDQHQSTCESFQSYLNDSNQNRRTKGFQTFDIDHLYLREPLKNMQSTKDLIATIFNPFMMGGNKRASGLFKCA